MVLGPLQNREKRKNNMNKHKHEQHQEEVKDKVQADVQEPTIHVNKTEQVGKTEQEPKLTPAEEKAAKKKAEQEKAYWNTLITRKEALDLARGVVAQREDSMRVMYMNLRILSDLLVEKGIITQEEMASKSQEILKEMYGEKAITEAQARVEAMKQQSQEEDKKDSKPE